MPSSFSFNGIKKPYVKLGKGKSRQVYNIKRNFLYTKGMPGALLESTDTEIKVIEQPVYLQGESVQDIRKVEEDFAQWLITDEPKELIFDDEPDRVYYAMVDGSLDLEEIVNFSGGVITFVCPDPYKYGGEKITTFPTDAINLANNGNTETYPVFEAEVASPITYMIAANDRGEYMQMGQPLSLEDVPFQRFERVLDDNMRNLTGWVAAPYTEEGYVTGSMLSDGNRFYVSTYGSASGVHGPAMEKVLPQALQDFRVEFIPRSFNGTKEAGRMSLYLMDANDNVIGRMSIYDKYNNLRQNFVEFRAGNKDNGEFITYTKQADNGNGYNDFYGMMRFTREGNTFIARIAKINSSGEHVDIHEVKKTITGFSAAKLAKIKIYMAKYDTEAETEQHIYKINVDKINQSAEAIPYMALAGDIITFDHVNNNLLINGESRIDLKGDLFSSYFSLKPGVNTLVVNPFNNLTNVKVRWRERFR
jgi:predicted phage tail component-like protein